MIAEAGHKKKEKDKKNQCVAFKDTSASTHLAETCGLWTLITNGRENALVRVVLLVKEHLVVNNGRDSFASKKSSVETIFGFLSADALFELDENFDQDFSIFRLILLLLIDDNVIDFSIFVALLLHIFLQVLVHIFRSNHVGEEDHPALHLAGGGHHQLFHDQLPARLAHALALPLLLKGCGLQAFLLQLLLLLHLFHVTEGFSFSIVLLFDLLIIINLCSNSCRRLGDLLHLPPVPHVSQLGSCHLRAPGADAGTPTSASSSSAATSSSGSSISAPASSPHASAPTPSPAPPWTP